MKRFFVVCTLCDHSMGEVGVQSREEILETQIKHRDSCPEMLEAFDRAQRGVLTNDLKGLLDAEFRIQGYDEDR